MPQIIPAIVSYGVQAATVGALGTIGSGIAGAIAGGLVASMLQPKQRSEGPRLGDLQVQSSSYGTVIPFALGGPRLAGQIIWASDLKETKVVTESGGKGGGGQESTSYTYKRDLLILLTSNVQKGIARAWMNGGLIWNKSGSADAGTIAASDSITQWESITFYSGDSAQGVDPIYEAAVGTANCSANRGRCTVMLANVDLGSSGNIPNFTFELMDETVVTVGTEYFSSNAVIAINGVRLADDRALAVFQNAGTTIYGRVVREAGISSSNSISGTNAGANDVIAITATTFLAIWNTNPGTNIKTTVLTTSGSPATSFSSGIEYTVDGAATSSGIAPFLGFISATQILAIWTGATNGEFRASVLGIAGTVVTPGTIYPLFSGLGLGSQIKGYAQLTATSGVAVITISQALYTMTVSIAGTVVTLGTPTAVAAAASNFNSCSLKALNSSTALLVYQHSTTELRSMIVTSSGSTSAPVTVVSENVQNVGLAVLSSSLAVCAWFLGPSSSGNIRAVALNSSGNAAGSVITVSSISPGSATNVVAISATKAMVMWRNQTSPFNLTYNTLTVA